MPSCAGFLEPKKSRLGPLNSTFNPENSTCSFSVYLNWFWWNSLLKCVLQHKIAKKIHKTPILASKVIEFGGNQEQVYDFLSVINSNLGPISHRY